MICSCSLYLLLNELHFQQTVRMVINYKRSQKTILRVNPRVPLAELLPAICEKCEFERETTILLRDADARGPLDLSSSLNDYAIRDVYARDTKGGCCVTMHVFIIIFCTAPPCGLTQHHFTH